MNKTEIAVLIMCILATVFAVSALIITVYSTSDEPNKATDNKPHDFDNIVDIYGKTQAVSETAASWEECMDGAHDRIVRYRDHSSIIAQMEWDIAVCDRLFQADGVAGTDLTVPGVFP